MNTINLTDRAGADITVTTEGGTADGDMLYTVGGTVTARDLIALGAFLAEREAEGETLNLRDMIEALRARANFTVRA